MIDMNYIDTRTRYITNEIMSAIRSGMYINSGQLSSMIGRMLEECIEHHEQLNIRQVAPIPSSYDAVMGKLADMVKDINEIKNMCSDISNNVGEIENKVTLNNIL